MKVLYKSVSGPFTFVMQVLYNGIFVMVGQSADSDIFLTLCQENRIFKKKVKLDFFFYYMVPRNVLGRQPN